MEFIEPGILRTRLGVMRTWVGEDAFLKEFLDEAEKELTHSYECYYIKPAFENDREAFLEAAIGSSKPMNVLYHFRIKKGDSVEDIRKMIDKLKITPRAAFFWFG